MAGMVKVAVVPTPSSLWLLIDPLCSSAIDRAMVSPSPAPGTERTNSLSARKNGVKIFWRSPELIPSP